MVACNVQSRGGVGGVGGWGVGGGGWGEQSSLNPQP